MMLVEKSFQNIYTNSNINKQFIYGVNNKHTSVYKSWNIKQMLTAERIALIFKYWRFQMITLTYICFVTNMTIVGQPYKNEKT